MQENSEIATQKTETRNVRDMEKDTEKSQTKQNAK